MKKERDMYFENQGYFSNPGIPNPMYQNGMYGNFGMPINQNFPYNMNFAQNFPNNQYQMQDFNSIEQRINRIERQIKRLDSRVSRLESKCNINSSYQSSDDGYTINETNMYMM